MITYSRPVPALSKIIPKKLTQNAARLLFPICSQKLLLKRPGKEGQFGKFKINIRIDELIIINQKLASEVQGTTTKQNSLASSGNAITGLPVVMNASSGGVTDPKTDHKIVDEMVQDFEIATKEGASKSQGSTPINQGRRKDSTDTNNSQKPGEIDVSNSVTEVQSVQTP